MNNNMKIAYHAFFESPKEYGHIFFDMSAENMQEVITFMNRHATARSQKLEDLSSYLMSILFALNINE